MATTPARRATSASVAGFLRRAGGPPDFACGSGFGDSVCFLEDMAFYVIAISRIRCLRLSANFPSPLMSYSI